MIKDKLLPTSIFCLAISIIIASINVSKSIENNGVIISSGVSQGLNNINNTTKDVFINNKDDSDILNMYTASVYLGISEGKLIQIINDGESKIPYIDIKGDIRFSKKALDKWVEESNFKM
ncbi:helix-turn-helix domain-containing protein [uncultured Clostridium sp.]|uniref:helix-turn-helix domain-containing protein n=1 Tax=uncultured Clostridium sp. TaxID=59620 RepID=UPI00258A9090|nr:helix-turn-helix domain-containing protein [uncultured Clostridium sp.]